MALWLQATRQPREKGNMISHVFSSEARKAHRSNSLIPPGSVTAGTVAAELTAPSLEPDAPVIGKLAPMNSGKAAGSLGGNDMCYH